MDRDHFWALLLVIVVLIASIAGALALSDERDACLEDCATRYAGRSPEAEAICEADCNEEHRDKLRRMERHSEVNR